MKLTYNRLKEIISSTYPQTMTYEKAVNIKEGNGRFSRRQSRILGHSMDRRFSVEIVGPKTQIKRLDFMVAMDTPEYAGRGIRTICAVVQEVHGVDIGAWITEHVKEKRNGLNGRLSIKFFDTQVDNDRLSVMFVGCT